MRASNVEICLLCRDSERAALNISRRLFLLSSFFNSAHTTVIVNDSEDDSLAAMKIMRRLFGGAGQRDVAIDVEGFSLQLRRPPAFSFRYPPQRIYDSASFAKQRASRYDRMSILRNRCLQRVLKSRNHGYMIMMDADIDLNRDFLAVDGIAHSFGIRLLGNEWKWNIVCANSVSSATSGGILLHQNLSETSHNAAKQWSFWDSLAYRDSSYAHYHGGNIRASSIHPTMSRLVWNHVLGDFRYMTFLIART
jgi:hypothetical protein